MPTEHYDGKMSSVKEKGKKAARKTRDGDASSGSEFGESIDTLSEVEVKMRLEAMDNFGKWFVPRVGSAVSDSVLLCCLGTWRKSWRLMKTVAKFWFTLIAGVLATMSTYRSARAA